MKASIMFAAALSLAVTTTSCTTAIHSELEAQISWTEQYRSEFEIPVGKAYTGRSPYMRQVASPVEIPPLPANLGRVGTSNPPAVLGALNSGLRVRKTGAKEQMLGWNADYEIVVSNTGAVPLYNVVVSDEAAPETSIVAAPGAAIQGNTARWSFPELPPGTNYTVAIKLTSQVVGTQCSRVLARSGSLSNAVTACTLWKGVAAVALKVTDSPDPIPVGERTTYTILVGNQGSAEIHHLGVTARFGNQVVPISAAPGIIAGNAVSFPVVASLGPKQTITYTVSVQGLRAGDSRNRIILTCDELKTPLENQESTTVY